VIGTTKPSEMVQHPGGLLDITQAREDVGCHSVFNKSGWVHCSLTASEFLRVYNVPLCMDMLLDDDNHTRNMIVQGLSLLIATSIFCAIWTVGRGGGR
jgi:hypothetical protein